MKNRSVLFITKAIALTSALFTAPAHAELQRLSTYDAGAFDEGAAEIAVFDPSSDLVYSVNSNDKTVDIIDITDPTSPTLQRQVPFSGSVNSVDVHNGLAAVAVEGATDADNGSVVFFDATGTTSFTVPAGNLPDSLSFSPDGTKVVVANEGEPFGVDNSTVITDPEGSVTVIDVVAQTATQLDFTAFNSQQASLISAGVKFTRVADGATVAEDVQPEFVAISPDGNSAVITLQENNAFAIVDLASVTPSITDIVPLGYKDWSSAGGTNGFDASDKDNGINIQNWPVFGMYQPDTIKAFEINGTTYYITANEGDASEVEVEINGEDELIFTEEERLKDVTLDPTTFPNATELQTDENLGRLQVTTKLGDTDGDGDFDEIYAYGGRSFSIWDASGQLVYDSGSMIEEITARLFPADFNTDNDENDFDGRSDAKGPEPEAVEIAFFGARPFALVGLERFGGFMMFDISNPSSPEFKTFISGRDFDGDPEAEPSTAGDLAPESITFIPTLDSPTNEPMIMVANEVSGTISFYQFLDSAARLQLFHASDLEGGSTTNLESAQNFAAIIEGLKNGAETAGDISLTLSAGDNYLPGPVFGAAGDRSMRDTFRSVLNNPSAREGAGRADIAIMNIIGFEASALGNHEFDSGTTIIEDNIGTDIRSAGADPRWLGADFPYLSANLDFSEDENISGLFTPSVLLNTEFKSELGVTPAETLKGASKPKLAASTIIRKNNRSFGIIGATTQRLSLISSPGGVKGLAGFEENMETLAAVIQPQINEILANGVDKVILVTHLQDINLEKQLVGLLSGVDIIVAGGSDTLQASSGDRLLAGDVAVEDYPFVTTNKDGKTAVIVSTGGQYKYVGKLVVFFGEDGEITSIDNAASRPIPTDETGITEAGWPSLADAFADETSGERVRRLIEGSDSLTGIADVVNVQDGLVFGSTSVFLEGRREKVRTEETNLGNLTALANLWQAQQFSPGVCISLKNGGGIRAQIGVVNGDTGALEVTAANPNATPPKPTGAISQLDIANSLRFNNGLTLQTVSAQQLREILEHGVAESGNGSTPGQFPQVAGLRFVFDLNETPIEFARDENGFVTGVDTPGNRVRFVAVVDEVTGAVKDIVISGGQIVGDPNRPFRMVTLDFLAGPSFAPAGGDGYPMAGYAAQNPAFANRQDLGDVLTNPGLATFANPGSEQDAFAEYLLSNYGMDPFDISDNRTDRHIVIGEDLTDSDNDGLNASVETALNEDPFSPNAFAAAAIQAITANSQQYGLYTEDNIQDLRGNGLIIQADATDVTLTLPLEISSTLNADNWIPFTESLEVTFPRKENTAFYRISIAE